MKGTWQTTDTGSGAPVALIIIIIAVLLGSGAAAAIATAVVVALIALAVVVVLAVAGLIAYLIWRARRDMTAAPLRRGIVPAPVMHQLPGPERPAIDRTVPRELHQHYHFHGVDEDRVAQILRRTERPEQQ